MRTIVCYGDSNTWGHDPVSGERLPVDRRWPGVLQRELAEGFRVVEEGLGGRTTAWDDPIEGEDRNGRMYLMPCLESHRPIDLVAIMLGTNDLKRRFNLSASDIAQSALSLARIAARSATGPGGSNPRVLVLAPPPIVQLGDLAGMFEGAEAKSRQFSHYYRLFADRHDIPVLDTGEIIVSSPLDGIHLEAEQHDKLGKAVAAFVRLILAAE